MQWGRIAKYFVVIWALTGFVGFVRGFLLSAVTHELGESSSSSAAIADETLLLSGILNLTLLFATSWAFCRKIHIGPVANLTMLWVLLGVSSLVNLLAGQTLANSLVSTLTGFVSALIGAAFARLSRGKATSLAATTLVPPAPALSDQRGA